MRLSSTLRLHRLLVTWPHVTADAASAQLFYVPAAVLSWGTARSLHCFTTVRALLEASPWFRMRDGRDHLLVVPTAAPGGIGRAKGVRPRRFWQMLANATLLAPFGEGRSRGRCRRCWHFGPSRRPLLVPLPSGLGPHNAPTGGTVPRMWTETRAWRVAYRGADCDAAGPRQQAVCAAMRGPRMRMVEEMGLARVELANSTLDKLLLAGGLCSGREAFEGLCSWSDRRPSGDTGGALAGALWRHSVQLWRDADFCLVPSEDPLFGTHFHNMVSEGCVPVVLHGPGVHLSELLPLAPLLPWLDMAVLWRLGSEQRRMNMQASVEQLLEHLLIQGSDALAEHRRSLREHLHILGWALDVLPTPGAHVSREATSARGEQGSAGLGVALLELSQQVLQPPSSMPKAEAVARGRGGLRRHSYGGTAAVTRASVAGRPASLRFAIIAFSDRPALRALTRPCLLRFVEMAAARGHQYDLLLEDRPLLDSRDWHPAWNKLAYARRALLAGGYATVVCVDDDVLITSPWRDPIYDLVLDAFLQEGSVKLVLASFDEVVDARVPLNAGVLALRQHPRTLNLIDELFRLARQLRLVDGYIWLPRISGLWDQDAFAAYVRWHGKEAFALVEHRVVQSIVRPDHSHWRPGDFAAHLTGLADLDPESRVDLLRSFLREL